jgi:hypothetical protein
MVNWNLKNYRIRRVKYCLKEKKKLWRVVYD